MPFNYGKGQKKHKSFFRAIFYAIIMFVLLGYSIARFVRMMNHDEDKVYQYRVPNAFTDLDEFPLAGENEGFMFGY